MARITRFNSALAVLGAASIGLMTALTATTQATAPVTAETTMSVLDGVYTEEQAARGLDAFNSRGCTGCHGGDFNGTPGGPKLKGLGFILNWGDLPASEVFAYMQANMPPGAGGTLPSQAAVDILAAIFQANEFPAGDVELDPETLSTILVERAVDD